MRIGNKWLARLPTRWRWTLHNVVGHPLSELLYQFGRDDLSDWAHDITMPWHRPDEL